MRKSPRGLIALAATAAALIAGQAAIGAAQAAATINVNPASPVPGSNSFPFGEGDIWPRMGFVYKNVPAFDLKAGDTIAFDLGAPNDVNIQLQIDMAATTVNGGDIPGSFTTVVPGTEVPANPKGDSTVGNYELTFTATAAFHFPGGGLIIRFSNPGGAYAGDMTGTPTLITTTNSSDSSGFFVKRFYNDTDGLPTYDNSDFGSLAGFRIQILDIPPAPAAVTPILTPAATPKKKCKKKHKRAASAKKCKKRR